MGFKEAVAERRPGENLARAINDLNAAFLWENRVFDTVKEAVWIDFVLPHTSGFLHGIAHDALERLDSFGDALHENFVRQSYPPTPSLDEEIVSVDRAFEIAVSTIDEVDTAIQRVIEAASGSTYNALALAAENLQQSNSADRTAVLQAWGAWSKNVSTTSFDNWVLRLKEGCGDE